MYNAGFLNASLSDLHLRCFDDRIYRLHRIVLCQSPFFQSLLLGGFSEESTTATPPTPMGGIKACRSHTTPSPTLTVHFEANITRAAFEFCLTRLYGGGPHLVLPPWADTASHPLSEVFHHNVEAYSRGRIVTPASMANKPISWLPFLANDSSSPSPFDGGRDPSAGIQPATPRFLLSLLVTATYLELTDIADSAMEMIIKSITPYTVTTYLKFALGHGIVGYDQAERDQPCRGCEGISTLAPEVQVSAGTMGAMHSEPRELSTSASTPNDGDDGDEGDDDDDDDDVDVIRGTEGEGCQAISCQLPYYYGKLSSRIAEACACYLAKWGVTTILPIEEHHATIKDYQYCFVQACPPPLKALFEAQPWLVLPEVRIWRIGGIPVSGSSLCGSRCARRQLKVHTSSLLYIYIHSLHPYQATWVRGILSSDSLYIGKSSKEGRDAEYDRYELAKRIVELRRREAKEDASPTEIDKGKGRARSLREELNERLTAKNEKCTHRENHPPSLAPVPDKLLNDEEEEVLEAIFEDGIMFSHFVSRCTQGPCASSLPNSSG